MKVIGRILIILLAASIVIGAAWALTHNRSQDVRGGSQFQPSANFEGGAFTPPQPGQGFATGSRPEGRRKPSFEGGRRGRGFLPFGWARNLVLIAAIVAGFVFIEYVINKRRSKQFTKPSVNDTSAT